MRNLPVPKNRESRHDQHCEKFFSSLLEASPGERHQRLVLTFINNLKDDLDRSLGHLAQTYTLHGYCQHLLYRHAELRDGLSAEYRCYPGLVSLIKKDWEWLRGSQAPKFVEAMRHLMDRLRLKVNDRKTRVCRLPEETFDFLGYTIGRCYSPTTGRSYLGTRPSKRAVQRICRS